MTGETGAGKSIVINAVNLILGSRALTEMIRTGADAAELEALFDIRPDSAPSRRAGEMGYDITDGLLVRRTISRAEGNRVYINGRLATLQVLAAVTENLASISGQHAHQGLLKEEQHLLILDQFGGLTPEREAVALLFRDIQPEWKRLKDLVERQARQTQMTELLRFQCQEIEAAAIQPGEDRDLEQERLRLKNAGVLYEAANGAVEALYSGSGSVIERVTEVRRRLEKMSRIDPLLGPPSEACADAIYRIEDIVERLRAYLKSTEIDEGRLEALEARLDRLQRLKRKYGGSLEAVLETFARSAAELDAMENIAAEIETTKVRLDGLHAQLAVHVRRLSKKRRETAHRFQAEVAAELATLKMKGTEFGVRLTSHPADSAAEPYLMVDACAVSETGVDRAEFTIAPNVGETLKPLAAIASGGELSRVVLALKSILAQSESVATIVFDEVDAGIGGAVAEVVGRKLAELARHHQVICITHLPQIAKFGRHHFHISKQVADGRTRTCIRSLSADERTGEVARMLAGEKITRLTLEHARELLRK